MKKILDLATQHESNSAKRAEDFRTKLEAELTKAEERLKRFSSENSKQIETVITARQMRKIKRAQNWKMGLTALFLVSLAVNLALIPLLVKSLSANTATKTIQQHHLSTEETPSAVIITLSGEHQSRIQDGITQIRIQK